MTYYDKIVAYAQSQCKHQMEPLPSWQGAGWMCIICGYEVLEKPILIRCAAARDGDCVHKQCPQLRDNEPKASGRHCPIDVEVEHD